MVQSFNSYVMNQSRSMSHYLMLNSSTKSHVIRSMQLPNIPSPPSHNTTTLPAAQLRPRLVSPPPPPLSFSSFPASKISCTKLNPESSTLTNCSDFPSSLSLCFVQEQSQLRFAFGAEQHASDATDPK